MAVRAVVFDLDGTLVDSRGDIAAAANVALAAAGFPPLDAVAITALIGDGSRALVARAAGVPEDDPRVDPMLAAFVDWYAANPVGTTSVFAHTTPTLDALAHLPLAVCTNKAHRVAVAVLDALALAPRFRLVVGGDTTPARKPSPLPLLHLAEALAIDPTELVMVGDGPQDVLAGKAAGARTIGVMDGGFLPRHRLTEAAPDAIAQHLGEVPAILRGWG